MKELNSILKIKETDKRLDNIESNFIEADYKVLQGEQLIANTNDGYTKDIKISGQSVLNVAPIKGPVDITAELSGTGTDITFENTSEGYVNGVTIKGKTYQNLITGLSGFHSSHTIITSIENKGSVTLSASDTNVNQAIWPSFLCDMNLSYSLDKNRLYTLFYRSEKADNTFGFIASDNIATPETYSNLQNKSIAGLNVALIDLSNFKTVERFRLRVFDITDNLKRRFVWSNIMIIEGDHTSNSDINDYFKGIAGVGDKGKNLFNKNDVIKNSRISNVSGSILSGFPDTIVSGLSKVSSLTRYTIAGRGAPMGVFCYDENMNFMNQITTASQLEFLTPDNAYFVRFHIESSQDLNRVQLEEGTIATPYEEYYDGVAVEVKSCGKNLCPTKSHDVVFATTGQSQNSNKSLIAKDIKITPGKEYCLSSNKFFGVGFIKIITHSTAFGESVTNHESSYTSSLRVREISPTHVSGSFIAGTNENYISLTTGNWLLDSANNSWSFDNIQLEEGTTITPYEPYKEHKVKTILQSPLMSLPNGVCDEVVDGSVIRRIGRLDVTKDSDIVIAGGDGQIDVISFRVEDKLQSTSPKYSSLICSSYFRPKYVRAEWQINDEGVVIATASNDVECACFRILRSKLETQDPAGLKKWLAANPITVYYELATPIISPIIDNKECVVLPNGIVNRWSEDKLVRNVGKVILDGSEEWKDTRKRTNTIYIQCTQPLNSDIGNRSNHIMCDKFNPYTNTELYYGDFEGICITETRPLIEIAILKSRLATPDVAGFKKWLSENNTTVWYELATSEVINIRKEQFKLKTYDTRTSISTNTVITPELNINSIGLKKKALIKPETKYQFKFKRASGTNLITVDLGGTKKVLTNESTVMITTPATLSHDELRISGYNVKVENVMTTEGESSCDYADGIASVGDKGKNLFDVNKWYYWTNRINPNPSISSIDNGISIDFRNTSGAFASLKNLKAGVYVLSANIDCGSQLVVRFRDCIVNDNLPIDDINSTIYEARLSNGKNSIIITLNRHCESITFQRANHTTGICKMTYFQLEEGTIATPYEEYYDGYRAKTESCGKNLFDIDNLYVSRMSNSVILPEYDYNASIIGKTDIGFSIKSKYNNGESWYGGSCDLKSFKTGQLYTMNADASTEGKHYYLNVCTYTDKNIVDRTTCNYKVSVVNAKSIDFVIPHNSVKVILSCVSQFFKANQILKVNRIQVEEGTKSPYTPHTSDTLKLRLPEPLRSVPSGVSDTIEKTNGEWVVARRCDEVILDGSKDWKYHSSKESLGLHRYILDFNKMKTSHDNSSNIYCNNLNIGIDNSEAEIWIDKTIITRKDINRAAFYIISQIGEPTKFKQWLSENPTTVIYELAQPTMHPLNTLQLPNGISDEIKNGKLIKKISKIVFDGSQEWGYSSFNTETKDFVVFYHNESMGYNGCINSIKEGYLCNSFESETPEFTSIGDLFATKECISGDTTKKELRLSIQKSKLLTADISGLNKWLLENPITVYYELDNKIELDYKSEDLNLKTYKDTTHFYSNTNVNPDLAIKLLENGNLSTSVKNLYDCIARLEKQVSILTKNGVLFE